VTPSPLPGPSGNVEFFLWLRHGPATLSEADRDTVVRAGVRSGSVGGE
jgi:23S rRNA (cytidine1920-2'-O)/16S rRNA (cytidine1409-2'-O)-methyltransferase